MRKCLKKKEGTHQTSAIDAHMGKVQAAARAVEHSSKAVVEVLADSKACEFTGAESYKGNSTRMICATELFKRLVGKWVEGVY